MSKFFTHRVAVSKKAPDYVKRAQKDLEREIERELAVMSIAMPFLPQDQVRGIVLKKLGLEAGKILRRKGGARIDYKKISLDFPKSPEVPPAPRFESPRNIRKKLLGRSEAFNIIPHNCSVRNNKQNTTPNDAFGFNQASPTDQPPRPFERKTPRPSKRGPKKPRKRRLFALSENEDDILLGDNEDVTTVERRLGTPLRTNICNSTSEKQAEEGQPPQKNQTAEIQPMEQNGAELLPEARRSVSSNSEKHISDAGGFSQNSSQHDSEDPSSPQSQRDGISHVINNGDSLMKETSSPVESGKESGLREAAACTTTAQSESKVLNKVSPIFEKKNLKRGRLSLRKRSISTTQQAAERYQSNSEVPKSVSPLPASAIVSVRDQPNAILVVPNFPDELLMDTAVEPTSPSDAANTSITPPTGGNPRSGLVRESPSKAAPNCVINAKCDGSGKLPGSDLSKDEYSGTPQSMLTAKSSAHQENSSVISASETLWHQWLAASEKHRPGEIPMMRSSSQGTSKQQEEKESPAVSGETAKSSVDNVHIFGTSEYGQGVRTIDKSSSCFTTSTPNLVTSWAGLDNTQTQKFGEMHDHSKPIPETPRAATQRAQSCVSSSTINSAFRILSPVHPAWKRDRSRENTANPSSASGSWNGVSTMTGRSACESNPQQISNNLGRSTNTSTASSKYNDRNYTSPMSALSLVQRGPSLLGSEESPSSSLILPPYPAWKRGSSEKDTTYYLSERNSSADISVMSGSSTRACYPLEETNVCGLMTRGHFIEKDQSYSSPQSNHRDMDYMQSITPTGLDPTQSRTPRELDPTQPVTFCELGFVQSNTLEKLGSAQSATPRDRCSTQSVTPGKLDSTQSITPRALDSTQLVALRELDSTQSRTPTEMSKLCSKESPSSTLILAPYPAWKKGSSEKDTTYHLSERNSSADISMSGSSIRECYPLEETNVCGLMTRGDFIEKNQSYSSPESDHRDSSPESDHRDSSPESDHRDSSPQSDHRDSSPQSDHRDSSPQSDHRDMDYMQSISPTELDPTQSRTPTEMDSTQPVTPCELGFVQSNTLEKLGSAQSATPRDLCSTQSVTPGKLVSTQSITPRALDSTQPVTPRELDSKQSVTPREALILCSEEIPSSTLILSPYPAWKKGSSQNDRAYYSSERKSSADISMGGSSTRRSSLLAETNVPGRTRERGSTEKDPNYSSQQSVTPRELSSSGSRKMIPPSKPLLSYLPWRGDSSANVSGCNSPKGDSSPKLCSSHLSNSEQLYSSSAEDTPTSMRPCRGLSNKKGIPRINQVSNHQMTARRMLFQDEDPATSLAPSEETSSDDRNNNLKDFLAPVPQISAVPLLLKKRAERPDGLPFPSGEAVRPFSAEWLHQRKLDSSSNSPLTCSSQTSPRRGKNVWGSTESLLVVKKTNSQRASILLFPEEELELMEESILTTSPQEHSKPEEERWWQEDSVMHALSQLGVEGIPTTQTCLETQLVVESSKETVQRTFASRSSRERSAQGRGLLLSSQESGIQGRDLLLYSQEH